LQYFWFLLIFNKFSPLQSRKQVQLINSTMRVFIKLQPLSLYTVVVVRQRT